MTTRATGAEAGLVGLWQMDATIAAGTQIEDTSPNDNHATLSGGPTLATSTVPATAWTAQGTIGTGTTGTVSASVVANAVADLATNSSSSSGPFGTITVDRIAPDAFLGSLPATTNATFFDNWPVTFSESVTGLTPGDFVTSGITVSDLQGSGASYTIDLTLTGGDGVKSISLSAGAAQDAATNSTNGAGPVSTVLDQTAPVATLPTLPPITNQAFFDNVPVTFTENIAGLELSDFATSGITVSDLQGSGASYTIDLTLTGGDGVKTLSLSAAAVTDAATNTNPAAGPVSVTLDQTAPTVTIAAITSPTNQVTFNDVAVTFSEPVTGLDTGDFALSGVVLGDLQGTGASYTVDVTVSGTGEGLRSLAVSGGTVVDAAGNGNSASSASEFTYDGSAPDTSATAPIGAVTQPGAILDVEWAGTDFLTFSVQLYYQFNGGAPAPYGGSFTTSPIAVDTAALGGNGTYDFWTVGTDIAGHVEAAPATPDITVTFNNNATEADWTLLEE
jgi:hypothetical protein